MFKRITLLLLVNILIVATISIVLNLLGVKPYLTANGLNYESLAIFCLVWGMGGAFISLMLSKWMVKMMMGVELVGPRGSYSELFHSVENLSRKAGLSKMPEVGIYHSSAPNAFATGPSASNSLVAVSTGLLQTMNREELEGVLGHEIAHIKNGDMVTMTLLQGVINAFVMFFARIAAFAVDQALRSRDDDGRSSGGLGFFAHMMVVFVFEMFFGVLGMMVVAAFSRYREFRADSGGAKIAGKEKMINALEALRRSYSTLEQMSHSRTEAQMNCMQISSKKSLVSLLSTHPPLEDRIAALKQSKF